MENIFVLLVLVALGFMGLLGFLLASSEKELKVKRREVEELVTRLENVSQQGVPSQAAAVQADNSAELSALRARNQELQDEVRSFSEKLEASRRSLEQLQAAQRQNDTAQSEAQELRAANEQLRLEIGNLRSRLQSTESGSTVAATQEAAERHAQLQSEIIELKQRLQESHAKLSDAETYRQKAEGLDALEAEQRSERQRLQARIAGVENEANSNQDKLRQVAELQQRLAEAQQAQAALRAESERHEQEIARWRERIAEGEEHRRRLAQLRGAYDQLLSKQASLSDRQREFHEELAVFTSLMAAPGLEDSTRDNSQGGQPSAAQYSTQAANPSRSSVAPGAGLAAPEESGVSNSARQEPAKRRFSLFSALILLAAAGFLGVQFLTSSSDQLSMPVTGATAISSNERREAPAIQSARVAPEPTAVSEPTQGNGLQPEMKSATVKQEVAKQSQIFRQEPRLVGIYEVLRSSRVYAGPTEFSELIGELEPGTKVNVVSGRDGWLEIHSKHGRPPGFIRREAATRLAN